MRAMLEKCDLPKKNAFNASILFQKSSQCKKCFFNAGTIAQSLILTPLLVYSGKHKYD